MQPDKLLEEGEMMLEEVHKHWIVYVMDIIVHTLGCLIFIVAGLFISSHAVSNVINSDAEAYSGMVVGMFVLLFWVSFFYAWTKNYFDVWYITDRHVIAVNQRDILEREEAFMELNRIQDVFFEKNGFLSTFLGYGILKVQSAGTEPEFFIEGVKDVEAVAHRIMELRDKAQSGKQAVLPVMTDDVPTAPVVESAPVVPNALGETPATVQ